MKKLIEVVTEDLCECDFCETQTAEDCVEVDMLDSQDGNPLGAVCCIPCLQANPAIVVNCVKHNNYAIGNAKCWHCRFDAGEFRHPAVEEAVEYLKEIGLG
jgi:hypothetical protein